MGPPLRYEFMTKLKNPLPEAFEIGGDCVIRQLAILLSEAPETLSQTFDLVFGPFASEAPYNGSAWRDVGIHPDLLVAFAERRGIELCLFAGNRKIIQTAGGSEKYITVFCWDNHCYCARNSQYTNRLRVVDSSRPPAQVRMERDGKCAKQKAHFWDGEVRAGLFLTEHVQYVRDQWLAEGIVPRANVSGVCKFNSITRGTPQGDLTFAY